MSYVVFPMPNVIFGVLGKKQPFWVLRKLYERCMLLVDCNGIYVGAYGIRPAHHRMNRIANHRRNIANPRNPGICNAPLQRCKSLINCCLSYAFAGCSTISALRIFTSFTGRSYLSVLTLWIALTIFKPSTTSPNTVYSPSRCGVPPLVS